MRGKRMRRRSRRGQSGRSEEEGDECSKSRFVHYYLQQQKNILDLGKLTFKGIAHYVFLNCGIYH